jgi:hypothetical protein
VLGPFVLNVPLFEYVLVPSVIFALYTPPLLTFALNPPELTADAPFVSENNP